VRTISGDPLLPKTIGLKASRRIPLFNGQIETRFQQYRLIEEAMKRGSPPVQTALS